jgi:hypothetical protein
VRQKRVGLLAVSGQRHCGPVDSARSIRDHQVQVRGESGCVRRCCGHVELAGLGPLSVAVVGSRHGALRKAFDESLRSK